MTLSRTIRQWRAIEYAADLLTHRTKGGTKAVCRAVADVVEGVLLGCPGCSSHLVLEIDIPHQRWKRFGELVANAEFAERFPLAVEATMELGEARC
jgi:hypothetical protein